MNNMERVYKIYNLLNSRGVVSTDAFLQELDISLATFKRDLAFMKNNLNAPIEWDSYERGLVVRGHFFGGVWQRL